MSFYQSPAVLISFVSRPDPLISSLPEIDQYFAIDLKREHALKFHKRFKFGPVPTSIIPGLTCKSPDYWVIGGIPERSTFCFGISTRLLWLETDISSPPPGVMLESLAKAKRTITWRRMDSPEFRWMILKQVLYMCAQWITVDVVFARHKQQKEKCINI